MYFDRRRWLVLHVSIVVGWLLLLALFAEGVKAAEIDLSLERVTPAVLVAAYYDACDQDGYVSAGAPVDDVTPIVAHVSRIGCGGLAMLLDEVLRQSGLERAVRPGPDIIRERADADERAGWDTLVYMPQHRDASRLAELAGFLVERGQFAHQGGRRFIGADPDSSVVPTGSMFQGASITAEQVDRLVFHGPPAEVAALRDFLPELDTQRLGVSVEVGVYEFQAGTSKASGLEVLGELFSGRLGVRVGSLVGGDVLSVEVSDLGAVLSLLDQDSRFRYVARPRLLVADRKRGSLFAGESRRVDGAVVVDGSGNPIVSKETLSAGLRLEVTPSVFSDRIDIDLAQVVSEFAAGRNDDLTTLDREFHTQFTVEPGRVYAIAGLDLERENLSNSRLFGLRMGRSRDDSSTQLFLLVKVDRVG